MIAINAFLKINNLFGLQTRTFVLYYCKIWEKGTLVRYMVPALRNSDSVAGMYDIVNGVFYTNGGTGTFIVSDSRIKTANVKIFKNENNIEADSFFET